MDVRIEKNNMNQLAIAVSVIMFPGIIAAVISDKIIVHQPKWDHFKFGIYSFVLGTTSYILLQCLVFIFDLLFSTYFDLHPIHFNGLEVWSIISSGSINLNKIELLQATLLSIPVAYFASFTVNYKIFNKIAQKLNISQKYGDENLFSFYLNADEIDWVYIRDISNNLTYQGQVVSYSENEHIQEIVLSNVTVYSYENSEEYYSVPSIYLCKNMGTFIIESIPTESWEDNNEQETIK